MQLPSVGARFDDRYVIERELGRGGFATVYLATKQLTGAEVALKVLAPGPDGTYDLDTRRRFLGEARLLERVDHPHVAKLLDAGDADGLLYIATEYVEGEDLSTLLRKRGRISAAETRELLSQLLSALSAAHRAGLVHRDVKPENVRVVDAPSGALRVKLLDFGIARATDDGAPSLTKTGELVGTPRYMAPEQLRERPATPASDIYSLGIVGFELMLGREALHGGGWTDQLDRLQSGHLLAVDRLDEIDPTLLQLLQRMTAVRPEQRIATAAAALRALDGRPVAEVAERAPRKVGAVAGVAVLVGVVAALVVWASPEDEPAPSRVPFDPIHRGTALTGERTPEPPRVESEADLGAPTVELGPFPSAGCDLSRPEPQTFGGNHFAYVPPGCADKDCPLVIALHGNFLEPQTLVDVALRDLAREHEFVVVAPFGGQFKLGTVVIEAWEKGSENNREIIRRTYAVALDALCFDRSRVFVLGYSDGAEAAVQLMCEPWVTAAMGFGLSLRPRGRGGNQVCPVAKAPLLWLHPTASHQVPLESGSTCTTKKKLGLADTVTVFRETHRCKPGERVSVGPIDSCERWSCEVPLTTCSVKGGRLWPGLEQHPLDGRSHGCPRASSSTEDVGEAMWAFFSTANALPDPPDLDAVAP